MNKQKNTIIAIGFLSSYTCYLNVPLDEALERYKESFSPNLDIPTKYHVKVYEVGDEFEAYSIEDLPKEAYTLLSNE